MSEVALSVVFEPVPSLTSPLLARLWSERFADFSRVEEMPPYIPPIESFDRPTAMPNIQFQLTGGRMPTRLWLLNESGSELVQLQQDWFARNWRRVEPTDTYPHYDAIREPFQRNLESVATFLADHGLGTLTPRQCEATYVNQIAREGAWRVHGDVSDVMQLWSRLREEAFLPEPEDATLQTRFVIRDANQQPVGRLNVSLQPAFRATDGEPIFVLTLTARGYPMGQGLDGVYTFLDVGHEWIVRGFTDITTETMHEAWRRSV